MKKRAFNKLYQNFFYIPKYAKLPDKVFRCRITFSVISVLACIAVMISSAFALFTSDIHNTSVLKSAVWNIHVEDAEGQDVTSGYTCGAVPDDMHTFNIRGSGGASGYCVIKVVSPKNDIEIFYTDKFSSNIQITIQAASGCSISFKPHWGDPSDFDIFGTYKNNDIIIHSKTPVENAEEENEEATSGDEDSAPSEETSGSDEETTPSEDTSDSDEGSTPSEDTSSSDEDTTSSEETSGSDEDTTSSEDAPSSNEDSTPSEETPSGDEDTTPSEDASSGGEGSTPSDDTPSSSESSAPSSSSPSSSESSAPSSSSPSSNESTTPSDSKSSSSEGSSSSSGGSSEGSSSESSSSDGGE